MSKLDKLQLPGNIYNWIGSFFFFFSDNAHSSELSNVVHGRCAWNADKPKFHRQIKTTSDLSI